MFNAGLESDGSSKGKKLSGGQTDGGRYKYDSGCGGSMEDLSLTDQVKVRN